PTASPDGLCSHKTQDGQAVRFTSLSTSCLKEECHERTESHTKQVAAERPCQSVSRESGSRGGPLPRARATRTLARSCGRGGRHARPTWWPTQRRSGTSHRHVSRVHRAVGTC